MKNAVLGLLFSLASSCAIGQVVVQAVTAQLQPQIGRDAKGFSVCGIRAVVLDEQLDTFEAYDFSINLRADMFGALIKAGKTSTSMAAWLKSNPSLKPVTPAPVSFWVARESEGNALMPAKLIPSESPGFILGRGEMVPSVKTIIAIAQGERMQFALRYARQKFETVVSFAGLLKEEEVKPLIACLEGMAGRWKSDGESSGAK